MIKKILIASLAAVLVIAIGFSAYNVWASGGTQAANTTGLNNGGGGNGGNGGGGAGRGRGQGQGGQGASGTQNGTGVPQPQNGLTEWVTLQGTVSNYVPPSFTLTTADGQIYTVEVGNVNYATSLGLNLKDGDQVTVVGFTDANGGFSVGTLTLDATGQSFTLRDELGRPAWRGGKGGGGNH